MASSRTIGELIPVAVEAVAIALRLGLCALKVRNSVGRNEGSSQSWSAVVSGMEEEQTVEFIREFSTNKVISKKKPPAFPRYTNGHRVSLHLRAHMSAQ